MKARSFPGDHDKIYLITNTLSQIARQPYETESLFQTLIESHPGILTSDQMGPSEGTRLLLVTREAGIPDAVGASNR